MFMDAPKFPDNNPERKIPDIKLPDMQIPDKFEPQIADKIFDELTDDKTAENYNFDRTMPEPKSFGLSDANDIFNKMLDGTVKELDVDKDVSESDKTEVKGGSYKDVKKGSDGETHEVHHMPSDSSYDLLNRNDGPAIKMDKADHRRTASCGSSREAREYQNKQRELIEQGKFMEALKMDIEDILEKFGDKYNDEIKEMLDYVKELIDEGVIEDPDGILDELYEMIGYGGDDDENN
jgi:uncharacterized protein YjgD (DUF1641 family)